MGFFIGFFDDRPENKRDRDAGVLGVKPLCGCACGATHAQGA
jgi:hypothetical protein